MFVFTAALSMAAPLKRTVGSPRRRGSPKIRLRETVFYISGEMAKKLLAVNSTDSVFAEFLLRRLLMFNCKQTEVPMKSVESKTSESI